MFGKKPERTQEEWAIIEYKHGYKTAKSGDEYINPYRSDTSDFSHYEEGFMDGKQNKLDGKK
ncbi:MAG: hypothetical protein IAF02_24855 [Anaerolineae bacterium]|nr:hypothetical protein [Anaerolineae bacterium]